MTDCNHLHGATELRRLRLRNTQVTSEGMRHLVGLPNLSDLDLSECAGINDQAVPHFQQMPALTRLNLWFTLISDEGLAGLAQMPRLVWLNLDKTRITDAGLVHLTALPQLRWLHLGSNRITNQGVPTLSRLKQLDYLNVTYCPRLFGTAKQQLKDALPDTTLEM